MKKALDCHYSYYIMMLAYSLISLVLLCGSIIVSCIKLGSVLGAAVGLFFLIFSFRCLVPKLYDAYDKEMTKEQIKKIYKETKAYVQAIDY